MLRIRPARPDEATAVSALALRSKALWGYDVAFLERCHPELTWTAEDCAAGADPAADGARRPGARRTP